MTVVGAFAIVAGLVLAGMAARPALPVSAGDECEPSTSTPQATATFQGTLGPSGDLESFGLQCTATPDREDRDTRTSTPTRTTTQEPEPSNTPAPPQPTATRPGGGVGSGGVQPPNTGAGPDTGVGATVDGGGVSIAFIMLGTVLALAGGGAVAVGLRRK